jgi:hypothetical protein
MRDIINREFDETLAAFVELQKSLDHSTLLKDSHRYFMYFVLSIHDWVYEELYIENPLSTLHLFEDVEKDVTTMNTADFPEKDEWLEQVSRRKKSILLFASR